VAQRQWLWLGVVRGGGGGGCGGRGGEAGCAGAAAGVSSVEPSTRRMRRWWRLAAGVRAGWPQRRVGPGGRGRPRAVVVGRLEPVSALPVSDARRRVVVRGMACTWGAKSRRCEGGCGRVGAQAAGSGGRLVRYGVGRMGGARAARAEGCRQPVVRPAKLWTSDGCGPSAAVVPGGRPGRGVGRNS
jgi:hypothetical protein